MSDPHDAAEQEADRVADAIMRSASVSSIAGFAAGVAHRKALGGRPCESAPPGMDTEEEPVEEAGGKAAMAKRDPAGTGPAGARAAPDPLRPASAAGSALPRTTRAFFEPRLGHSFGDVRVHADGTAATLARSVGALAFTVGRDIYFGAGAYAPDTHAGRRLLAHELTHVAQQRRDRAWLQRYSLRGFPPAEEAAMRAAIPVASSKVASCGALSWWGRRMTRIAINDRRYDYVPSLGLCGWTFPGSWYIEIGKEAFSPSVCCDLAATIAHEASHTQLYTEGRARRLECKCFACSC